MNTFNHIFLVDDDKVLNFAHTKMLRLSGYENEISSFENAYEALNRIEQTLSGNTPIPNIIFLDIQMPGMNGWDFLANLEMLLAPQKLSCKVYMLSAVITPAEIKQAEDDRSISGVIQKPLTIEKLKKLFSTINDGVFFIGG